MEIPDHLDYFIPVTLKLASFVDIVIMASNNIIYDINFA